MKTRMKEHVAGIKHKKKIKALGRYNIEPIQINFRYSKVIYPSRFYSPSIIVTINQYEQPKHREFKVI